MIDLNKRAALLARVGSLDEDSDARFVTLEQFFEGNDDPGSIWCNLERELVPGEAYGVLKGILERPEVADVLIGVTQFDGGSDEWPFADQVVVVTSASEPMVLGWFGELYRPTEIGDGRRQLARAGVVVPGGMKSFIAWWD